MTGWDVATCLGAVIASAFSIYLVVQCIAERPPVVRDRDGHWRAVRGPR